MTKFQKIIFFPIVGLQILVLCYMVASRMFLLEYGTVVKLKCIPVDPRSLFSGDYVILNFKISSFTKKEFKKINLRDEKFKKMETVYLGLVLPEGEKFWQAVEVSHDLDYLKTKYSDIIRGELKSTYRYNIKYGVESYFVPQFEGKKIEKKIKDVYVEIALSESGESGIKRLFIKDEEVRFR